MSVYWSGLFADFRDPVGKKIRSLRRPPAARYDKDVLNKISSLCAILLSGMALAATGCETLWTPFLSERDPCAAIQGDRAHSVGVYDPATGIWLLRSARCPPDRNLDFELTAPRDTSFVPIVGDWDGDGIDSAGLYDPNKGTFYLRNANSTGPADAPFTFQIANASSLLPIAGDWDLDGRDSVGLYDPLSSTFHLKNENAAGGADLNFNFGSSELDARPIAGDWNGDGRDSVGLYVPTNGTFFLTNQNAEGTAEHLFLFGPECGVQCFRPLAGDWNGDGQDTVGIYAPSTSAFYLQNRHAPGVADVAVEFGPTTEKVYPVTGHFGN